MGTTPPRPPKKLVLFVIQLYFVVLVQRVILEMVSD